jgi:hypothetical protein
MQVISVFGALAILGAFAANLFGWIRPSNLVSLWGIFAAVRGREASPSTH